MLAVDQVLGKVPLGSEILTLLGSFWKVSAYSILPLLLAFYYFHGEVEVFLFVLVVVSLFGVIFYSQDILLYHNDNPPNSRLYVQSLSTQTSKGLGGFESVQFLTEDYVSLHGYLLKYSSVNPQNYPCIVYLHGNAGNIGHRLPNATEMVVKLRCNVLLVEYRGYGKSSGSPSEKGLYLDAKAAIHYVKHHPELSECPLVLFGRSLGGAVAIQAATKRAIADVDVLVVSSTDQSGGGGGVVSSGTSSSMMQQSSGGVVAMLVVENTFTHIADVAEVMFQIPGFSYIPRLFYKNKFASSEKISQVEIPSLFVSGQADQLVPPHMMSSLFSRCAAHKKRLLKVRGGTHNETWMTSGYYDSIKKYMDEVLTPGGGGGVLASASPSSATFRPNGRSDTYSKSSGVSVSMSSTGGGGGGMGTHVNSPVHSIHLPSVAVRRENETTHDNLHYPQNSNSNATSVDMHNINSRNV